MTIFLSFGCVSAQETEINFDTETSAQPVLLNILPTVNVKKDLSKTGETKPENLQTYKTLKVSHQDNEEMIGDNIEETDKFENDFAHSEVSQYKVDKTKSLREMFLKSEPEELSIEEEKPLETDPFEPSDFAKFRKSKEDLNEKFHWKPAIIQSLYFLGIQHGFRMMQTKTTRELDGPFFRDWGNSVKNLNNWRDGDSSFTNYVAHPMQGAVTGRIFINNSDKSKKLEFGMRKDYWESRLKAMAWSAVWSTQFELGPISEASIGNVGLYDRIGPNRMGWVDLVVTPTAGTAALVGEDLIDKYILKKWLEEGSSRTKIKVLRTFITPFQSFTNILSGKAPWKRYNR